MSLLAVARHVARLSRPGSLLDAVLEKCPGTDEWDETNIDGGLTRKAVALFDRMTAAGMSHVDMNATNVTRDRDGDLRLIDMESARVPDA